MAALLRVFEMMIRESYRGMTLQTDLEQNVPLPSLIKKFLLSEQSLALMSVHASL
jgi:hypothetical protein